MEQPWHERIVTLEADLAAYKDRLEELSHHLASTSSLLTEARTDSAGLWSTLNQIRGELIDASISKQLNDRESDILRRLQLCADEHVERVAPRQYPATKEASDAE